MKLLKFWGILTVLACVTAFSNNVSAAGLRAGTSKVNVTPLDQGRIHDSLYARALILEAGGTRIAFVSIDLIHYNTDEKLLEDSKKKFNLDELYFCPSHTHSGANSRKDPQFFADRVTKALEIASKNMFDAHISAGYRSFPQLGFNRLIVRDDGHARETWFGDDHYQAINKERIPFGPVDPEVGIIKLEDAQGTPRAFILNYACHTDAVWANFALSADWAGVATRMVEEAFGKTANCLFIQGAAGNIAPMFKDPGRQGADDPRDTDYSLIERMGKLLSIEAVKLANELRSNLEDIPDIKFRDNTLQFTGRFDKAAKYAINISTILINNRIAIATFPGEPFIKFQFDWKKDIAPYATPFFFGYTWSGADWPTYVPDIRSAALGGFGADMGYTYIELGAGERIMNKHLENYYWLNGLMRSERGPE